MKILLIILSIPILAYIAILAFTYLLADEMMFHPPARTYVATPEHVFFTSSDASKLMGVFLKAENPKANIFYCHGNGEDIGMVYPFLDSLRKNGFNVFSYDYNGYGYSEGKPSEKKLYLSAQAAWKYANESLKFEPQNTFLMGFSLGSAPVSHVSTLEKKWKGVVIAGGISKGATVYLPINIIPWKLLDNRSKLSKLNAPLLLLHGSRDIIVPPHNATMNYKAANEPKKLVILDGFGHNDIFSSPKFWAEVRTFLTQSQK